MKRVEKRKKRIREVVEMIESYLDDQSQHDFTGEVLFRVPMNQGGIRDALVGIPTQGKSLFN